MKELTQFITENWVVISVVLVILVQILQLATKRFSEHEGFTKVALFIADVLSIFTPKGDEDKLLKLPFVPSKTKEVKKEEDQ